VAQARDAGERGRPHGALPVLGLVVLLLAGLGAVVRTPLVSGVLDPAAPTLTQSPALTGPQPSSDPAHGVLTRMTDALRRHDADRFASVAAPGYPAVRTHLREIFAGLAALPLASFDLSVDPARVSVPAAGSAPGAVTLPVIATYRLRGWDDAPLTVPLLLVVAPGRGGWGVVQDRTTTDRITDQRLEPWFFPGLYVTRTAHVLVVGDHPHATQARRLARTLEALTVDVRRLWPERTWNGTVVAYAVTSAAFVRSWYGRSAAGDAGNGDRAAFVAKVVTLPTERGAGAVRMVLTPYLLERTRSGSVDVLRHEMTHVATARLGGHVPAWLVEGAAEYTGFARRNGAGDLDPTTTFGRHGLTATEVSSTADGRWRPTLLDRRDFYTGSESAVDEHYNSAFITCLYIADHYGDAALRRLYERSAGTTEAAALSQVLHTTRGRLVRAVGGYAAGLRRRLVFS
jgi:hypothetical protein